MRDSNGWHNNDTFDLENGLVSTRHDRHDRPKKPKILVVDDDPDTLELISLNLSGATVMRMRTTWECTNYDQPVP